MGDVDRRLAVPGPPFGCLSPGMTELDSRNGTLTCEETGDRPQVLDLRVAPEPQVAMGPSAIPFDGGRLDKDKARAAHSPLPPWPDTGSWVRRLCGS